MRKRRAAASLLFSFVCSVLLVVASCSLLLADATPGAGDVPEKEAVRSLVSFKKGGSAGTHGAGAHGAGAGKGGNGNSDGGNSRTPALGGVAIIGAHGASQGGRHNGGSRRWGNCLAAAATATALGLAVNLNCI